MNTLDELNNNYKYLFKYLGVETSIKDTKDLNNFLKKEDVQYWDEQDGKLNYWIILKQVLDHKKIYFPRYDQLNDPFECIANIDCCTGVSPELLDAYCDLLEKQFSIPKERSKANILGYISKKVKFPHNPHFFNYPYNFGIYSLSEDPVNIQMWSHYANRHAGICIAFKINWTKIFKFIEEKKSCNISNLVPLLKDGFRVNFYGDNFGLIKVNYSQEVQNISLELFMKAILNVDNNYDTFCWELVKIKHKNWNYEQEWRLVCFNNFSQKKDELYPFNVLGFMEPIGIILGHNMKRDIKDIIKNHYADEYNLIDIEPKISTDSHSQPEQPAAYSFPINRQEIIKRLDKKISE